MNEIIVNPSSQVDSVLPVWIRSPENVIIGGTRAILEGRSRITRSEYKSENHKNFVNFMERSAESEERLGFGQDILQNLLKYRDFNTYEKQIITHSYLDIQGNIGVLNPVSGDNDGLSEDEDERILLTDAFGFPDRNGVILIDDEVILYRRRVGNELLELERGVSGTAVLPTFKHAGKYIYTTPDKHLPGAKVHNLSVMFMVAILDQIHKMYAHGIDSTRVVPEINRSSVLKNIKDFFRAKGSKLGIKALFKILFNENDVDVTYPGDRMIIPSESTYVQPLILRTIPVPEIFTDPGDNYTTPDKTIGSKIEFKSYSATVINVYGERQVIEPGDVISGAVVDYASSYQFGDMDQYELILNKDSYTEPFLPNPITATKFFTKKASKSIVVESTYGFPESGVIFIDHEAVYYTSKTETEFLGVKRGHLGVATNHEESTFVYGPYYVETTTIDKEGVEYVSRSFPLGLVAGVQINDPGLLHTVNDTVVASYDNKTGSKFYDYDHQIELKISSVSDGNIDEVIIQDAVPENSRVGDFVWFDESFTTGGGAQAIVDLIEGKEVIGASGSEITTIINSHRLLINVFDDDEKYIFVPFRIVDTISTTINDTNNISNISRFKVVEFDVAEREIEADVLSKRLVESDDIFYDDRGQLIRSSNITIIDEPKDKKLLFVDSTDHILRDDILLIDNGAGYGDPDPDVLSVLNGAFDLTQDGLLELNISEKSSYGSPFDEHVKVQKIQPNESITVIRGYESARNRIPDGTAVTNISRYLYCVETSEDHGLRIGDTVVISGSEYEEVNGLHEVIEILSGSYEGYGFCIYTKELYDYETEISYATSSLNVEGPPAHIKVISGGYGYDTLPICVGLYKREIDRAEVEIDFELGRINDVTVISGGSRYIDPVAIFYDYQGPGYGAEAVVTVENGTVTDIVVTETGEKYDDPRLVLVETAGKYICTTKNIGQIQSIEVVNPGRIVSQNPELQPDILITTRFVIEYVGGSSGIFREGDIVHQGDASGIVVDYDDERQIVTLENVRGRFENDTPVTTDHGVIAIIKSVFAINDGVLDVNGFLFDMGEEEGEPGGPTIRVNGQADVSLVIEASATGTGKFIDDKSKVSESCPVIQDSYKYQWFSYQISSPLQKVDYDSFVEDIIHPSGFIRFGDVTIHSSVHSGSSIDYQPEIDLDAEDICDGLYIVTEDPTNAILLIGNMPIIVTPINCEIDDGCITIDGGFAHTHHTDILDGSGDTDVLLGGDAFGTGCII